LFAVVRKGAVEQLTKAQGAQVYRHGRPGCNVSSFAGWRSYRAWEKTGFGVKLGQAAHCTSGSRPEADPPPVMQPSLVVRPADLAHYERRADQLLGHERNCGFCETMPGCYLQQSAVIVTDLITDGLHRAR
jgi:hypothetical protein